MNQCESITSWGESFADVKTSRVGGFSSMGVGRDSVDFSRTTVVTAKGLADALVSYDSSALGLASGVANDLILATSTSTILALSSGVSKDHVTPIISVALQSHAWGEDYYTTTGWDTEESVSVGEPSDEVLLGVSSTVLSSAVGDSYSYRWEFHDIASVGVATDLVGDVVTAVGAGASYGRSQDEVALEVSTCTASGAVSVAGTTPNISTTYSAVVSASAYTYTSESSMVGVDIAMDPFLGGHSLLNNIPGVSMVILDGVPHALGAGGLYRMGGGPPTKCILDTGSKRLGSKMRKRVPNITLYGITSGEGVVTVSTDESNPVRISSFLDDRGGDLPRAERFKVGKGTTGVYWGVRIDFTGVKLTIHDLTADVAHSNRRIR